MAGSKDASYGRYVKRLGGPPRPMTDYYADEAMSKAGLK